MRANKKVKRKARYIPLSDIKEINDVFLSEMQNVKQRLGYVKDVSIISAFHEVLLSAYKAAIEIKTLERQVDLDIRLAEIEAHESECKPWRRCWLWRLIFRPLTNRAQDIIEERAEVEADIVHTAEEEEIRERQKFLSNKDIKSIKSIMQEKLQEVIKDADNAELNEAFNEPSETVQANTAAAVQMNDGNPAEEPRQEQLRLDVMPPAGARRPRPPRSCRKPATPGQ